MIIFVIFRAILDIYLNIFVLWLDFDFSIVSCYGLTYFKKKSVARSFLRKTATFTLRARLNSIGVIQGCNDLDKEVSGKIM